MPNPKRPRTEMENQSGGSSARPLPILVGDPSGYKIERNRSGGASNPAATSNFLILILFGRSSDSMRRHIEVMTFNPGNLALRRAHASVWRTNSVVRREYPTGDCVRPANWTSHSSTPKSSSYPRERRYFLHDSWQIPTDLSTIRGWVWNNDIRIDG